MQYIHFSYDYPVQERETCQSRAFDVPTLETAFRNYWGKDLDPNVQPFYIFVRLRTIDCGGLYTSVVYTLLCVGSLEENRH
jgi:hypothetical protein